MQKRATKTVAEGQNDHRPVAGTERQIFYDGAGVRLNVAVCETDNLGFGCRPGGEQENGVLIRRYGCGRRPVATRCIDAVETIFEKQPFDGGKADRSLP